MRIVNIDEAKTHFSKLVKSVLHGHEVLIAMDGKPAARLGPISKKGSEKIWCAKKEK